MLTKSKLPLLVVSVICLEIIIYVWAVWTSTWSENNFFAIEPKFIFDKCARNSGRVSSALNLGILLMIGYFGLKRIYLDPAKKEALRILITLFAVNHLTHFFFVFQTFKHHTMALNVSENTHGFMTFICILLMPALLWTVKNLNRILYISIILHLINVSYFIMETFYNKIKPDKPAYHNQFGIVVTTAACIYVLYGIFRDYKLDSTANRHHGSYST
jgi:hypothetical protein